MLYFILGVLFGIGLTVLGAPKLLKKLIRAAKDLSTAYENISIPSKYPSRSTITPGQVSVLVMDEAVFVNGVPDGKKLFINGIHVSRALEIGEIQIQKIPESEKEKIIAQRVLEAEKLLDNLYLEKDNLESEIFEIKAERENVQYDMDNSIEARDEFNQNLESYVKDFYLEIENAVDNFKDLVKDLQSDVKDRIK